MSGPEGSRRRNRKRVLLREDGELFDVSERRPITVAELREYLLDGGLFEARTKETGRDCTYEVLRKLVGSQLMGGMLPGLSGNPLAVAGGGGGKLDTLASVLRLLDNGGGGRSRWEHDDWDEPPRRRKAESRGWDDDPAALEDWGKP